MSVRIPACGILHLQRLQDELKDMDISNAEACLDMDEKLKIVSRESRNIGKFEFN